MKPIPFSAVEILPALLDKTKTQTIRPLFKTITGKTVTDLHHRAEWHLKKGYRVFNYNTPTEGIPINASNRELNTADVETKPRLKVGEQARLYWKQRGTPTISVFCRECGVRISGMVSNGLGYKSHTPCGHWNKPFKKIFGEVEITEVFEIEMHKIKIKNAVWGHKLIGIDRMLKFSERHIEIPKRDGFDHYESLFLWFNMKYNLSAPKRFVVYRWEWP